MIAIDDVVPLHLAEVVYPRSHPLADTTGPVYGFAIRHPDGIVLVDTGVGPPQPQIDRLYQPRRTEPRTALLAAGFEPDRVVAVINSHLHFDHCGGNADFTDVPIYVQRAEWEAAKTPHYTIRDFIDFEGARYQLLDGDTEVMPGIRAIATPGHTPGHQSVLVETGDGPVVIAAQVCSSLAEFTGEAALDEDEGETPESIERLRALGPVLVYFSHDGATWAP